MGGAGFGFAREKAARRGKIQGMRILQQPIKLTELLSSCEHVMEGDMVKADVDLGRGLLIIDADLHADMERALLEDGAHQEDLWGINIYPGEDTWDDIVEFDSMINIRPRQGNRSRFVEDATTREKILEVVKKWLI